MPFRPTTRAMDWRPGWREGKMESLWGAVRRWADHHGHEYVSSYGVVDVGAT